jgi:uncharacterized protein (DUF1330 family)
MPAFVIGIPHELSPEPMIAYRQQAEGIVTKYGGRYWAVRQHRVETLEGDWLPLHGLVILEFPSFEQARAWYHSPEYAPLRAMRMAGDRWDFVVVDAMAEGETLRSLGVAPADDDDAT